MPSPPESLRVLFVSANPDRDISSEAELKRVRSMLDGIPGIDLQPVLCATIDDLQNELIKRDFDFVHLVAHGATDAVTLEDAGDLWGEDVPASMVVDLLRDHRSLKCVVLNTCNSASWITEPLGPALVAMRGPIGDDAALEFSDAFYRSVAAGRPLDFALDQGKKRAERKAPHANFQPEFWPECFGVIGIRSYPRFKKDSHTRCHFFCDLEAHFPQDGEPDWAAAVAQVTEFLEGDELRAQLNRQACQINLDCPMAIALLAGRLLGPHAKVYPLQSRPVRALWKPNHALPMPDSSPWQVTEHPSIGARKMAVSISVAADTQALVGAHLDAIGEPVHWVDFRPLGGTHQHAIRDPDHANALALTLAQELSRRRIEDDFNEVDLFFAAPGAFMFLLGQQGAQLGRLNLHHKIHGQDRYVPSFCSK
ncbi:CHAT domain protein [Enhygromyxa salina]|uniref:CHAT domain protein n=1 Tax=Enhygromyxa salina TaxID=215803 RepID=A0A2S9XEX7_9BACT|nr:SAVED domain-containing protein [Enhygromyxa salina]PRP91415.1 CHAT domain protein [Enhygromyxa salina]